MACLITEHHLMGPKKAGLISFNFLVWLALALVVLASPNTCIDLFPLFYQ